MSNLASIWKFYLPEDGGSAEDAHDIPGTHVDASSAAERAAEHEWSELGGNERTMSAGSTAEMILVVIHPRTGEQTTFRAWHEASVEHCVRKA